MGHAGITGADGRGSGSAVRLLAAPRPASRSRRRLEAGALRVPIATPGGTVHRLEGAFPPGGDCAGRRFGAGICCPLVLQRS